MTEQDKVKEGRANKAMARALLDIAADAAAAIRDAPKNGTECAIALKNALAAIELRARTAR